MQLISELMMVRRIKLLKSFRFIIYVQLAVDKAIFLNGGVPSASGETFESLTSTLRFVPASLESGDGEREGDLDLCIADTGGVDRDTVIALGANCASGVAPRLPLVSSVRSRATKLFVDTRASA